MPRNSSAAKNRDPWLAVRMLLGVLLAANLVAAGLILFPPGGSVESLGRQMTALQEQVAAKQTAIRLGRQHAQNVEEGRAEGDKFVKDYFLPVRTGDNTLDSELQRAAAEAKIKPKGTQLSHEPIEGSDTLQMVSLTATYEGRYADVLKFVHAIDQSPRLMIIESLNAVPQQGKDILSVSMKIDAFERNGDSGE